MLSYSPLTLPADRLFFDEETKNSMTKPRAMRFPAGILLMVTPCMLRSAKVAPALHIAGFTKGGLLL